MSNDTEEKFEISPENPPTREVALADAAEVERVIGEVMNRRMKMDGLPIRPLARLISYTRTVTPLVGSSAVLEHDLIDAQDQARELRGRLESKTNLLQLGAAALKLSTQMGLEQVNRISSLRAALHAIASSTMALPTEMRLIASQAIAEDDAQQELDNTIAVDTTGDLFGGADPIECHGLDNDDQVFFYEHDFYVLSNFSAFRLQWKGIDFDTSEHAYHWEKFAGKDALIARDVMSARSAHVAFKLGEHFKPHRRADWDQVKVPIMLDILRAKAEQHEYVRRKLLSTGNRELIEDSWRDAFWGWGPNKDGQNMLGKLWMQVRAELRA